MLSNPWVFHTKRPESSFLSKHGALLDIALRISDILVVMFVAFVIHWLKFGQLRLQDPYGMGFVRAALLTLLVFPATGLYGSLRGEGPLAGLRRLWMAWSGVMLLLLVLEWAFKSTGEYSRVVAGAWFLASGVFLSMNRFVARCVLGHIRAQGIDSRRVILIGSTQAGKRIAAATKGNAWMGLDVVGYVGTPYDQVDIEGVACLGDMDDIATRIKDWAPDQIWIALPMRAEEAIRRILQLTLDTPATVRFVPDFFGYELINHHTSAVAGVPVITLRCSRVEGHARIVKAIEDRSIALFLLILLAPLMMLIAVGVRLSSPGPVIYRQKRHGLGGKEILVRKFRSMRIHSEAPGKVTQASRRDPRVTRLGKILRSTSLDELPQLINVLQGDMSIVGPRPHAVEHNRQFCERLRGYMQRHGVKPGMTGLAQVRGLRGETDTLEKMARRVECDISYIEHWSLWLDIKIILRTPWVLIKKNNAY